MVALNRLDFPTDFQGLPEVSGLAEGSSSISSSPAGSNMKVVDIFFEAGGLGSGFKQAGLPATAYGNGPPAVETEAYRLEHESFGRPGRAAFSVDAPPPTVRGTDRPGPPDHKGHRSDGAPAHAVRPRTADESRIQIKSRMRESGGEHSKTDIEPMLGNAASANPARLAGQGVKAGACREPLRTGSLRRGDSHTRRKGNDPRALDAGARSMAGR